MTGRRRYDLARKALEVSADCADALTILAEQAKTLEEAIDLYEKAVAASTRGMGDRPFKEDVGDFWLVAETRPYMRARAELAKSLVQAGRLEEAREHFRALLRLNTHDSQGIRYELLTVLLRLDDAKGVEELLASHPNEGSAFWCFAAALHRFRLEGDAEASRTWLARGQAQNPYVAETLMRTRNVPKRLPRSWAIGSPEESAVCVAWLLASWDSTPDAWKWLDENWERAGRSGRRP